MTVNLSSILSVNTLLQVIVAVRSFGVTVTYSVTVFVTLPSFHATVHVGFEYMASVGVMLAVMLTDATSFAADALTNDILIGMACPSFTALP